jgi:hypothetical protein
MVAKTRIIPSGITVVAFGCALLLVPSQASAQCSVENPSISNGTLQVAVSPSWGGAITNITPARTCVNVVNNGLPDPGRSIQLAFRRQEPGVLCWVCDANCNGPWNPTQAGSPCNGHLSGTDAVDQEPGIIHTRSQPIYNFDDDDGRSNIVVDQWVLFARPNVVEVHYTVTNNEPSPFTDVQSYPVAFLQPFLDRAYRYSGPSPWTYDTPEEVSVPVGENALPPFTTTEPWIAWIGSDGFGLGLYISTWEKHTRWNLDRVYPTGSTNTHVLHNWYEFTALPGQQYTQVAYLIYGTLDEIRTRVYEFEGRL